MSNMQETHSLWCNLKNRINAGSALFFVEVVLFYLIAVLNVISGSIHLGIMYFCIGSITLCNGINDKEEYEKDEEDQ